MNAITKKVHIVMSMLVVCVLVLIVCSNASKTYAYDQKNGSINGKNVNVRTGAGTTNSELTSGGVNVQLNTGDNVTIIGEAKASDGALWYKVTFKFGSSTLTGYVHSDYVKVSSDVTYKPDADFEAYLKAQGFPDSYKEALRALHQKYPKWVFVADKVNYTWDEVLENESKIGTSLISVNSISSWKSTDPKAYNWDTGKWYGFDGSSWAAASEELVAYCLDPRNFLDEQSVFQFESLAYESDIHTLTGLRQVLSGSFMSGVKIENNMYYSTALMNAAKQSGVSPYNLAVRIIQEQGINGIGKSISGTVSGYEGYYNYFNIGAYATGSTSAIINGLKYAKSSGVYGRPWNTRYKAILGGAEYLGTGYITQGQDTLYYQKFDLVGTPYTHQYMTHILAPSVESIRMAGAYSDDVKNGTALVFKIPVYKNMPSSVAQCPTGDGSPNNALSSLKVSGYNLTPTFSKFVYDYDLIVKNTVSSITVSATALDSSATVSGTGKKSLKVGSNNINITVKAKNGAVRTYTIVVARKNSSGEVPTENDTTVNEPTTTDKPVSITSKYTVRSDYISGVEPGTTVKKALAQFTLKNASAKIFNANNKQLGSSSKIGTGCKYVIYDSNGKKFATYTFLIYGDVSGDGTIDIKDLLYVKLQILGKMKLSGLQALAADASRGNDGVDIKDLLYIKLHILDKMYIVQ